MEFFTPKSATAIIFALGALFTLYRVLHPATVRPWYQHLLWGLVILSLVAAVLLLLLCNGGAL